MYFVGILDGDGDTWGVRIPDLPGCCGGGPTAEAAIADATSAVGEWVAAVRSKGVAIRTPRLRSDVVSDPEVAFDAATESVVMVPAIIETGRSVKANISLDAGQLAAIDDEARRRGLTRSTFIVSAALAQITRLAEPA